VTLGWVVPAQKTRFKWGYEIILCYGYLFVLFLRMVKGLRR
jgi:hypothetical protein